MMKEIMISVEELEEILDWARKQRHCVPMVHVRDIEDMLVIKMVPAAADGADFGQEPSVKTILKFPQTRERI